MITSSPLGRYAAITSAIAMLFVIVAAVLSHILHPEIHDGFLDGLAYIAMGVLVGTPLGAAQGRVEGRAEGESTAIAKVNGALAQGHAANARLDAIGAPPAASPPSAVSAVDATGGHP